MDRTTGTAAPFGIITAALIVLQSLTEWMALPWLDVPHAVLVWTVVGLIAVTARGGDWGFIAVCTLAAALLPIASDDWQAVLAKTTNNLGFLISFFCAATMLRTGAATSPAMARAGLFLAGQPPGRRYLSLSLGAVIFAPVLNFGSIQLLGTMATTARQDLPDTEDERLRARIRRRRMLLAIQRGFLSAIPWSPMSFSTAIAVATIPGARWSHLALPGLVTAFLVLLTGWALDTLFKPRIAPRKTPLPVQSGSWSTLWPLLGLLLTILGPVLILELLFHVRIVGAVLVVAPIVTIAWILLQTRSPAQTANRLATYITQELSGYRGNLLLLLSAGFLGSTGTTLISPLLAQANLDLSTLPDWALLMLLVWCLPLAGQIGANPILTLSLLAPLLPVGTDSDLTPTSFAVAAMSGWVLTGLSSPFTATNMLVGRLGELSARAVGWRWNRGYFLTVAVLVSLWSLLFAALWGHR